ncbi:GNAT family N-acetyltransferase [Pseudonocardia humida]|uniref:GNAT family N-acetyltransferase n=1 Tax=Pseudonocardia humida TaxID=2800819 RepID=A0ABT1A522_9PSEU|nr:GNAT family N-acetyltransferase [Pseudonocardia humida]MCO1658026.1 GNAT family N-acetyltransferase [Pseudonocardia humida]
MVRRRAGDAGGAPDVLDVSERFWSSGGERLDVDGAVLVRNPAAPGHPSGTFLTAVRTGSAEQLDRVLARCHDLVEGGCRRVVVDAATPPVVAAHLAVEDWTPTTQLHLVLPATAAVPAAGIAPRPLSTDEDWARATELFRADHLEEDARHVRSARPAAATAAAVALRRSLTPAATWFAVERDGGFVAMVAAWAGDGGTGVVEDVFVRPDARHAGLARELLRFAVGQARAGGAGPVLIGAETDDTPKHLYARFGFRPAAVGHSWVRGT